MCDYSVCTTEVGQSSQSRYHKMTLTRLKCYFVQLCKV